MFWGSHSYSLFAQSIFLISATYLLGCNGYVGSINSQKIPRQVSPMLRIGYLNVIGENISYTGPHFIWNKFTYFVLSPIKT
jgi:hypothetical protein